jgi:hypothetical protein
VIADFGCGDAAIARCAELDCVVHSFDLVAKNDYVTACDIMDVPVRPVIITQSVIKC